MNDFWGKKLGIEPQQPVQPTRKAWWQDEPQQVYDRGRQVADISPYGYASETVPNPNQEKDLFNSLRRINADQLNDEQMEFMAEYELKQAKYNQSCPQCGSNNFAPQGSRIGGVLMPTDKCFECGGGVRSPEPALGGRSNQSSISTRQIDTGGGAGSMYLQFRQVPMSYRPRS